MAARKCAKCSSERVAATRSAIRLTVVCKDCGHKTVKNMIKKGGG